MNMPEHVVPSGTRPYATRQLRRGFTLVELLVVIAIIGLLIALLLPAITGGTRTANQTAIKAEISNLDRAIESYKNDVAGGSYPPDAMIGTGTPNAIANKIASDFKRHLKKAFPRHREPSELIDALVGNGTASLNLAGGMTPAEAMVFWLQRFSSDPKYPISGPGGPAFSFTDAVDEPEDLASRNWILDFTADRYGPRDDSNLFGGRFLRYDEPSDFDGDGQQDQLQISFWQYYPPKSVEPIAYFDASRGIHDIQHPNFLSAEGELIEVHPLKLLKAGQAVNGTLKVNQVRLVNDGKFQIMHCGGDDEWGDFRQVYLDPAWFAVGFDQAGQDAVDLQGDPILLYPEGPFTFELGDTVTNFGDHHSLQDAQ